MSEKAVADSVKLAGSRNKSFGEACVGPGGPCEHVPFTPKKICEMDICENARAYVQSLVDAGEWHDDGCEQCVIEFVCEDPLEHCMNPEDVPQWWETCVRDRDFWKIWVYVAHTQGYVLRNETHMAFHNAMVAGVNAVMAKYELELVIQ